VILTASSLERAEACPASFWLPQIRKLTPDAERGTSIHAFVRRVLAGATVEASLAHLPEELRDCARAIDFRKLGGDLLDVRAEAAYLYNVETGEASFLGLNIDREYEQKAAELGVDISPMHIGVSVDFEGKTFQDIPVANEIKTGNEVEACAENRQVHVETIVQHAATGREEVEARVLYIRPSGKVFIDPHVFTLIELEDIQDDLLEIHHGVYRAKGEVRASMSGSGTLQLSPGDHCRYCPAFPVCPAQTAMVRAMSSDVSAIAGALATMSPAEKGMAHVKERHFRTLLDVVHDALKLDARQEPIPLPDGKELREIVFPKEYFNRQDALALLRTKGATEEEIKALYQEREESQVRALKKPKPGETLKKPRRLKEAGT
jgi:hypothetical protein